MIYQHISDLIGNTPLLRIPETVHELSNIDVYAKLELRNPFGSVKDRVAWAMVGSEIEDLARNERTVIESSSGNTAKALLGITSTYNVPFRTVTNRIKVDECRDLLRMLGADIHQLPANGNCHDPNDPNDPVLTIEREVAASGGRLFHTSQYTNVANVEAHKVTGAEIASELGKVDYFIGGLGTTGSTRGIADSLKKVNPQTEIVGVIADPGDFIPGIRTKEEMYEVGLYQPSLYKAIEEVTSSQAIEMTLRLARYVGLFAGPTTGATLSGAVAYLRQIDRTLTERRSAVFLACDRLEGYLSYLKQRRPELFDIRHREGSYRAFNYETSEITELTPDDAQRWIKEHDSLVVDTRGSFAYATGHLPRSINIVDEALELMFDNGVPFPPGSSVLMVCPMGTKSRRYAAFLSSKGVNAASLAGGVIAWRDAEIPLERSIPPRE